MTKAEIVHQIAYKTGTDKQNVAAIVEVLMETMKQSMSNGNNVYSRGFGTLLFKKRAEKLGRNISRNTTIKIPAHTIPSFKPAKEFIEEVKAKVKV